MNTCYFNHTSKKSELFECIDGENQVCYKCCTLNCAVETPEFFMKCSQAGHPTWPSVSKSSSLPNKLVCLESYWGPELHNPPSVKPFFEALLPHLKKPMIFIHRYIETEKGLRYYTQHPNGLLWKDQLTWDTPLYYMAFHGRPGELKTVLNIINSKMLCEAFLGFGGYNNVLYFGSCSLFKGNKGQTLVNELFQSSGSKAIIGYKEDVDWMDSMIIDMVFMKRFYELPDPWSYLPDIYNSILHDFPIAEKAGYSLYVRE